MPSTLWYIIILVVTATVVDESSAKKKRPRHKKVDFFKEAKKRFKVSRGKANYKLAPGYGTLDWETLQEFDDSLKVMVGEILKLKFKNLYTWDKLKNILDNNAFLSRHQNSSVNKLGRITFGSTRFFGQGEKKPERVHKITVWFNRLVGNIRETNLNLSPVIKMVSKIDVKMLKNLWKKLTRRLVLIDQGILRFPDIGRPFLTLYRINLMLKCTYNTFIFHQTETSEIVGLFQREIYYPDRDYIKSLKRQLVDKILDEVDHLFSD